MPWLIAVKMIFTKFTVNYILYSKAPNVDFFAIKIVATYVTNQKYYANYCSIPRNA